VFSNVCVSVCKVTLIFVCNIMEPVNDEETIRSLKEYLSNQTLKRWSEKIAHKAHGENGSTILQRFDEPVEKWSNCLSTESDKYKNIPPVFPYWKMGLTSEEYKRRKEKNDGMEEEC